MTAVKSPWLIAFAVVSVVHLVLNGTDAAPWDSISKCFIAPLLTAWVVEQNGPRLLVVALGFCFLGDLFLELDGLFVVGMVAFAVAHICFIRLFLQRGALDLLLRKPWIIVIDVAAAIALVAWAWGGLDTGLRPMVPVYAVLLLGTAASSLAADVRAGLGGALFLVSDGLIALGEADRIDKDATWAGLVIMALYILAIFFLATGILNRERRTIAASSTPGFDPTIRTDCWPRLPEPRISKG